MSSSMWIKKVPEYMWLSYLEKFVKKIVNYREEAAEANQETLEPPKEES